MSIALYRKYRPKTFGEVTNQNHVKVTLQNEIMSDRLGHAYLFCGPRGTGKTTLARLLAKTVNCKDRQEGEPCNACVSCEEIMANKAIDIIEVDAASHTGVDNVRENIINNARFTPGTAKYKVFIIDEVHMLSTSAFNALLKILEEPPAHVIFILATTEVHKVPVTIISRCQRFDFKKISINDIALRLQWIVDQEQIKVEEAVLRLVAKHAGGCVRDAESLLEQILSLGEKHITLDQAVLVLPQSDHEQLFALLKAVLGKNVAEAVSLINQLVEDGIAIRQFSNNFVEFARQVLIYKVTAQLEALTRELPEDLATKIMKLVEEVEVTDVSALIESVLLKKRQFQQSPIAQLPLELAVVHYVQSRQPRVPVSNHPQPDKVSQPTPQPPTPTESKPSSASDTAISQVDKESKKSLNKEDPAVVSDKATEQKQPKADQANAVTAAAGLTLTYNQVLARWPAILQAIKAQNYSLGMSLSVAKPVALEAGELTLGFLFDLQKDRVETPQSIKVIQQAFRDDLGADIKIKTVVDANLKLRDIAPQSAASPAAQSGSEMKIEQKEETPDPVNKVLDAFGGSLVDGVS